jgi:hypothetical protein
MEERLHCHGTIVVQCNQHNFADLSFTPASNISLSELTVGTLRQLALGFMQISAA